MCEPEVTPVAFGIAGSSNGRTALSGGVYLGSSPSPAANGLRGRQSDVLTVDSSGLVKE